MRNLAHTIGMPTLVLWMTIALSLLFAPALLFAANDAIWQSSDAQIQMTVSGTTVTLKVSGAHTVDSLAVDAGSFDVVLSNSSLVVSSADRYTLTASPNTFTTSFTCGSSESVLTLERHLEGTATVTVTPSTTVCGGGGGGGSPGGSGSSGGSGGGSAADAFTSTAVAVAPAAVAPAAVAAAGPSTNTELSNLINLFIALGIIPESKAEAARAALSSQGVGAAVSAKFTKGIGLNSKGEDVKRLQTLLNSDADTRVAASGVGSAGSETETFGPATENAVKKFQVKYGIAGPGSEGYGFVGPKTRAKLDEVFGGAGVPAATVAQPSPVAAAVSPVFNSTLSRGSENSDVKRLQQLLNSDPDTRVASSGVGSPGNETNFFGAATENAVKKFQAKYGIVSSGDPASTGYGMVGAKTRAKLQEVFGQ